jgi:hypothetical protein
VGRGRLSRPRPGAGLQPAPLAHPRPLREDAGTPDFAVIGTTAVNSALLRPRFRPGS